MALSITLYEFRKRYNSTMLPTNPEGQLTTSVVLKEDCSFVKPIFIINGNVSIFSNYNYVGFNGTFYWITDCIARANNLVEIVCNIDVLATYKAYILDSTQYVLYANVANTEITDKRIPTLTTTVRSVSTNSFDVLGSAGYSVVVSVIGQNSTSEYALTIEQARSLLLNFDDWYVSLSDIPYPYEPSLGEEIASTIAYIGKLLYGAFNQIVGSKNAADCVRSAFLIPLNVSSIGGYSETISLGSYKTNITGLRVSDRIFSDGVELTIPWQAADWRRNSPYTEIFVVVPYLGVVSINASEVIGLSTLHVSVMMDKCTGDSIFTIWGLNSNHVLGQYATNLGSSFAIGSSNLNPANTATNLATAAAGAAALISGVGGVAAVAAGGSVGLGITNAMTPQANSIAVNSGIAATGFTGKCSCYVVYHDTIVSPHADTAVIGEPYSKAVRLETLSGYVQTQNASVSVPAKEEVVQQLNSLLDGGIYIE